MIELKNHSFFKFCEGSFLIDEFLKDLYSRKENGLVNEPVWITVENKGYFKSTIELLRYMKHTIRCNSDQVYSNTRSRWKKEKISLVVYMSRHITKEINGLFKKYPYLNNLELLSSLISHVEKEHFVQKMRRDRDSNIEFKNIEYSLDVLQNWEYLLLQKFDEGVVVKVREKSYQDSFLMSLEDVEILVENKILIPQQHYGIIFFYGLSFNYDVCIQELKKNFLKEKIKLL